MARLVPALAAAALLAALAGCSSPAPAPTATRAAPGPTTTVTATATVTPSATATRTAPSPQPSASTRTDPNAPAGQCPDADLKVSLGDAEGGAGSVDQTIRFTNTGSARCALRGAPGVSVVGDGNGTQLGAPASRSTAGGTVSIPAGGTVSAPFRYVNIEAGGALGSRCPTKRGDGYRVYPPHSFRAVFITAKGVLACTSRVVWMHVGAVGTRA